MELIEFTDAESNMVDLMGEYAQYQELPAGHDGEDGNEEEGEEEVVVVEKKSKAGSKKGPGASLPAAAPNSNKAASGGGGRATVNGKDYDKLPSSGRVREDESGNKASKIRKVKKKE